MVGERFCKATGLLEKKSATDVFRKNLRKFPKHLWVVGHVSGLPEEYPELNKASMMELF